MTKKLLFIIIAVFIAILAIVGYVAYKSYNPFSPNSPEYPIVNNQQWDKSQELPKTESMTNNGFSAKGEPALGWKLYKNSDFGFEIQYPTSWTISEENIENVRGEQTKGFFFKKPLSDLRFAILPRDGLSYGLPENGNSTPVYIGGSLGMQSKYVLKDGRRLWLVHPQYGLFNWSQDIGRIDAMTSAEDPSGDTIIFEKMLNTFKLTK